MTDNAYRASNFCDFFRQATGGDRPYPYQEKLATVPDLPEFLDVPMGLGKTAASILAWLFRRRFHPNKAIRQSTPRRIVYCLPMRVLVEQTYTETVRWLDRLGLLGGRAEWNDEANKKELCDYKPHPEAVELPADGWISRDTTLARTNSSSSHRAAWSYPPRCSRDSSARRRGWETPPGCRCLSAGS